MTLQELLTEHGLEEKKISAILEGMKKNNIFTSSEENLDIRYGKLKGDFDNLTTQHGEATKLIEELKKGTKGNEELQGKVTAYETQIADLQEQLKQTQIESAIKVALLGAKATDIDYMTFKLKEKGEIELAEDGSIKGIDDKISGLKTQFPNQFETAGSKDGRIYDVNKLPKQNDDGGVTKEAFDKMGYQERLKLYNENPETYEELSKN